MPNSIDFYKGIFLHVIPVRIIVPCFKVMFYFFVPWNQKFSDVFGRYRNWTLAWNAVSGSYNVTGKISHCRRRKSACVFKLVLELSLKGGRSSRSAVFCKKYVLKNFVKFKEKHLCWSLFYNKVTGLSIVTLLKKRLQHGCFSVNFTLLKKRLQHGCFSVNFVETFKKDFRSRNGLRK